jgi:FG-GAP repeat
VPVRVVLVGSRVWLRVDDVGVRYPLRVDPLVQQAELTASDGDTDDQFGYSVAMSGGTLVVGAPFHDGVDGAVYVFTRPASGWQDASQAAELTMNSGVQALLGTSVAIDGDTIAAGAPGFPEGEAFGAVAVYTMPAGGWHNETQTATLFASDGAQNDQLGESVSISGDEIVAGAPGQASGSSVPGKVYEFTMPPSGWQDAHETAELTATDGVASDNIGYSVAISGGTIAAGAPSHQVGPNAGQGATYVFTMPAGGWQNATQTAELTASDGGSGDILGYSVAMSGDTIVAGAPGHVNAPANDGKVYVFTMPGPGWQTGTQDAAIAGVGGESTLLGWSVAMDGDTIVAGALLGGSDGQGAAFAYTMPPSGWQDAPPVELTAADGVSQDQLGQSVAVSGDTIVAGADWRRVGPNTKQGSAYVFGLEDPTSTMAACGSSPSAVGSPVTCTASVSDFTSDGLGTPGGVVTFSTPASAGAFVGPGTCTLTAAASGVASCNVSFIPSAAGSWTIGAAYGGDSMHEGSSGTAPVTALDPTTAAAVCYPVAGQGGPTCTVTATITDVAGGSQRPPTGSVAFGAVPVTGSFTNGAVCTLLPTSATSSSCQVSFSPSQTASYQLTVSYGGDGFHQGSSAAFGITSFASTIAPGPGRLAIAHEVRVSNSRVAGIALSCSGVAGASCAGKLTLTARVSRKVRRRVDGRWRVSSRTAIVTLGSAKYALIAGHSKTLRVKLVAGSLGWIDAARGHRLTAQATAAQDGAATLHVSLTLY